MPKQPQRPHQPRQGPPKPYTRPDTSRPRGHPSKPRGPRPPPSAPVLATPNPRQAPQSLDLSNRALTEPPNLRDLANLGKLNLSDCRLTTIDFVHSARRTLTWLNVSGNNLVDPLAWNGIESLKSLYVLNASHCGLTEVPACVSSLTSLKALVLSHNSIKSLDHVRDLSDLNTIVVSNNELTELPPSLTTLPALKKISAAHNRLTQRGLPDLSALSHLTELRLHDNAPLTSLPPHFGTWGKHPVPPNEDDALDDVATNPERRRGGQGKRARATKARQGLETVDLSSCGFENWFGLRGLAEQDGIVNLGLKGNKVAEDAVKGQGGFDEFKDKLRILLPSLRILDNVRFDAKYHELKSLRESRTPEQAILDAGPMALRLLEQGKEVGKKRKKHDGESSNGLGKGKARERDDEAAEAAAESQKGDEREAEQARMDKVQALLKEREREKENKRRRRKGLEELGNGERRREREERLKREREERGETVDDAAEGATREGEDGTSKPRAKKPRKDKPRTEEDGRTDSAKEAKVSGASRVAADSTEVEQPSTKADRKREKRKAAKAKGGVLDALRADPSDSSPLASVPAPASASKVEAGDDANKEGEPPKKEEKQKTSVLRVVEVKKASKQKAGASSSNASKVDVGELLGLGKAQDESSKGGAGGGDDAEKKEKGAAPSPFALLGSGGGSVFGGGGWD